MLKEVLVQDVGAHAPLRRGVRIINEEVRECGPLVIAHGITLTFTVGQSVTRRRCVVPLRLAHVVNRIDKRGRKSENSCLRGTLLLALR